MGNMGFYGQRKFENLDYSEAIDTSEVESELKTGQIIIQLGAGGGTHQIAKPAYPITLTNMILQGSVNGATTGTTAGLTFTLKQASAGGATTATIAGGALDASTTAGSKVESFSTTLSASVPATVALYAVCGATTLIDDNASAVIQYIVD